VAVAVLFLSLPYAARSQVSQTFDADGGGTPYSIRSCIVPPLPTTHAILDGGPTGAGRFLRLAFSEPVPNHGSITFDQVGPAARHVVVDFDLRLTPGNGRADGVGFALLNAASFPSGGVCAVGAGEEPNIPGSLGIGFDIHQAEGEDLNDNHVSVHFDGVEQDEFDVAPLTLAGREWIHVRVVVGPGPATGIAVTVVLEQRGSPPVTVVDGFDLSWVEPYPSRVHLVARSGGQSASHDLDNVEVRFLDTEPSVLSFGMVRHEVVETDGQAVVTVTRRGDATAPVAVGYHTSDASALAGADYEPAAGTLVFAAGEVERSFAVLLIDDGLEEPDESFQVVLETPSGGAVLGGPSRTGVEIVDDEAGRRLGHWSDLVSLPTVAVHAHLLPTGRVLLWKESGDRDAVFLWDPVTGGSVAAAPPSYDVFCAGHSFLADGRLLVTGGHFHADGHGVPNATLYDPFAGTWADVPPMGGEGGRWYPTNTTLGNGDVVVLSGSYDTDYHKNTLPQVFEVARGDWRDLDDARDLEPLGAELYPRMFVAPDGRLFKAGDPRSWFLVA
jgi:hypothetical protein